MPRPISVIARSYCNRCVRMLATVDFLIVITVLPCVVLSVVATPAASSGRGSTLGWVPFACLVGGGAVVSITLGLVDVPLKFSHLNSSQNLWVRALGATASDAAFVTRGRHRQSFAVAANNEYLALLESVWVQLLLKLHTFPYEVCQVLITALWVLCHLIQPEGAFRDSESDDSWSDLPVVLGLGCSYAIALDLLCLAVAKLVLKRGTSLGGLVSFGWSGSWSIVHGQRNGLKDDHGWGHMELTPPPPPPLSSKRNASTGARKTVTSSNSASQKRLSAQSKLRANRPDHEGKEPSWKYGRRVRAWFQLLDWLILGANAAAMVCVQAGSIRMREGSNVGEEEEEEEWVAWAVACYLLAGSVRLLRAGRFFDALETSAFGVGPVGALLPNPRQAHAAATLKSWLLAVKGGLVVVGCGVAAWACEYMVLDLASTPAFQDRNDWTLAEAFYFSVVTLSTAGVGDYAPSSALSRGVVVVSLVVCFTTLPRAISDYLDTCRVATTATLVQQRQGQEIAAKVLQRMARKAQARRNLRSFVERTFVRDFVDEDGEWVARLVDKRSKRVRADLEAVKWPALRQMLCALPFAAVPIMVDASTAKTKKNKSPKAFPGNEPQDMAQRLLKLEVAMDALTSMAVTQSVKVDRLLDFQLSGIGGDTPTKLSHIEANLDSPPLSSAASTSATTSDLPTSSSSSRRPHPLRTPPPAEESDNEDTKNDNHDDKFSSSDQSSGVSSAGGGATRSHSGPRRPRAAGRGGSAPSTRSNLASSTGSSGSGRGGGGSEEVSGRTHTPGRSRQQRTPPSARAAPAHNQGDPSHDSTFESPPLAQLPAARRPSTGKSPYMMGRFEDEGDLDS